MARALGVGIAYMDKRRDLATGEVKVVGMSGEVVGKNVIIVDDMIVTGSTMMESAEYLKKVGAISVSVAATHHLYLPGVQEKLEMSEIDEVVVSDTVAQIQNSKSQITSKSKIRNKKLKVLSVAQLIVDELS
jgi:ribose-phosphate pyrophosphokinase